MPTYIMLTTLTADGAHTVHANPDRLTALADEIGGNTRKTCCVSTRTPQAAQKFFKRIASDHHDRNILTLFFRRE